MRRTLVTASLTLGLMVVPTAAYACGFLIAPNRAVNLLRTTTFVGYHAGIEHYVTSFEYAGGGAEFGSIIPLPGVPSKIKRAGDWTLQRLQREVAPVPAPGVAFANADGGRAAAQAKVIIETKVDALDITVLEGGAPGVVEWANDNGFDLPDDAVDFLSYYADRSPYFMAARFAPERAEKLNQNAGDGTPIHLWIPTDDPWIPLKILAFDKGPGAPVEADLFLLTDGVPTLLPAPVGVGRRPGVPVATGMRLERSESASTSLLEDLAGDKGMGWLPTRNMWFSYLRLDAPAEDVTYDIVIVPDGFRPSWSLAGFLPQGLVAPGDPAVPRPGPIQIPIAVQTPEPERPLNLWPMWLAIAALTAWYLGRSKERASAITAGLRG